MKGIGIEEFKERCGRFGVGAGLFKKKEVVRRIRKTFDYEIRQNLDDVLKVSKEMRDDVSRACIWGKKARFPGQEVSFNFEVFDEMEVWFGR